MNSPGLFSLTLVLWFHCVATSGIVISAWVSNPLPPNPGETAVGMGLLTELNDDHSPPAFLKAKEFTSFAPKKPFFFQCLQKFRQKKAVGSGAFQQLSKTVVILHISARLKEM